MNWVKHNTNTFVSSDDGRDIKHIPSPDGTGDLTDVTKQYDPNSKGEDEYGKAPSGKVYQLHGDRGELFATIVTKKPKFAEGDIISKLNKKYSFKQLFGFAKMKEGDKVKGQTSLFETIKVRTKEEAKKFWADDYGWGPTIEQRMQLDEIARIKHQKKLEYEASQEHKPKQGLLKQLFKNPE